ncbi:inositol monophosphatase family protein [Nesterenkonia sp. F]|uniref:inositol monophosphatase family protein n=1 Tax=Nesterenkonia sp. F TaxID=795955 RepID=UPI000255CF94|nr:inositol monophosphatase family protein [Nesterenkonia sp. F]
MTEARELLAVAAEAAAAGAAVLAEREDVAPSGRVLRSDESGLGTKSSESDLVTDFDRRSEQAVRAVIGRRRPQDAITGEEYGTSTPERASGIRWSIDPLDGTTNFVRGIVYYGTSVAVQGPDGDWLAGVVHAPALDRLWWASRGAGAFTGRASAARPGADDAGQTGVDRLTGPQGTRAAGLLSTGFGYDAARREQQVSAVVELLNSFGNLRRLGAAALDICMVADGTVEAYAEYGIQEHDWAAGALIAEEAGVTMRRPLAADGAAHPDWCIAGDLGVPHEQLRPAPRETRP